MLRVKSLLGEKMQPRMNEGLFYLHSFAVLFYSSGSPRWINYPAKFVWGVVNPRETGYSKRA